MKTLLQSPHDAGRRQAFRIFGAAGLVAGLTLLGAMPHGAQASAGLGVPKPGEKVEETIARLFGNRPLQAAGDKLKVELPLIAENGAVVPVRVESNLPMEANNYVKNVYIITDKNRRPLNTRMSLTPDAGRLSLATNIRMGDTSDVRVIVETSDGSLYQFKQEVKVTVGGCGG
jgi:sulfur-oxidizing protein SoxY